MSESYLKSFVVGTSEQIDNQTKDPSTFYLKTDDNIFTRNDQSNIFEAPNTHKEQEQFDKGLNSDGDINVTNSVIKVLDSTLVGSEQKDIVTQYSADEIVKEVGQGEEKQTYNYTFPNASGEIALKNDIAYLTYPPVVTITPNEATKGTLSDDDYENLSTHDDVKIKLNNEYYILMDDGNTEGIMSYIHDGWNGNSNQVKSINITKSTKAWTLVVGKNKYYRHYIKFVIGDKTFYYDFSSTQKDKYTLDTLPVMPDSALVMFVVAVGGYYSNVNGMIYRSTGDNVLKAIIHGLYTDNGTSFTYLTISGEQVTSVTDEVVEL